MTLNKKIPLMIIGFFVVFMSVDGLFAYLAIKTDTGVVNDTAYESGLAYDKVLDKAQAQAESGIQQTASFQNGILRWALKDAKGQPIQGARVTARLVRPVQSGYDFDVVLTHQGQGLYEGSITAPLKGLWDAKLDAQWDNTQHYRTTIQIIIR